MQLCQHSNNMGTTMKLMTSIDCPGPSLIWARDHQSCKSATKCNSYPSNVYTYSTYHFCHLHSNTPKEISKTNNEQAQPGMLSIAQR